MIEIDRNGNFTIPNNDLIIGHYSETKLMTKHFFVSNLIDMSLRFTLKLYFDNGNDNEFILENTIIDGGSCLEWNYCCDKFYFRGFAGIQIIASNSSGEVYKSNIAHIYIDSFIRFTNLTDTYDLLLLCS